MGLWIRNLDAEFGMLNLGFGIGNGEFGIYLNSEQTINNFNLVIRRLWSVVYRSSSFKLI